MIREKGEQELLGYLTQWCSELNFLKESADRIRKRALQLHVDRIFDNPRWVDFVPFNRRYRPDVLNTAHLVEGAIACPCCGRWSHFEATDSALGISEHQAEQTNGMEMT